MAGVGAVTALDDRPASADALESLRLAAERQTHDAWSEGYDAGYAAAEQDMAAHWAKLAHSVRADAERLTGRVREPVARSNGSPDDSIWFTAEEWAAWAGAR